MVNTEKREGGREEGGRERGEGGRREKELGEKETAQLYAASMHNHKSVYMPINVPIPGTYLHYISTGSLY